MRRDETQVDETRLLVAQRLDQPCLLPGSGTDGDEPQIRGGLGRQSRERAPHDLVVQGLVDLERQPQARAEEAVLLVDIGGASHERRVLPDRDDRGLDGCVRVGR